MALCALSLSLQAQSSSRIIRHSTSVCCPNRCCRRFAPCRLQKGASPDKYHNAQRSYNAPTDQKAQHTHAHVGLRHAGYLPDYRNKLLLLITHSWKHRNMGAIFVACCRVSGYQSCLNVQSTGWDLPWASVSRIASFDGLSSAASAQGQKGC